MYPPLTDEVLALAQSKYERLVAQSVVVWSKTSLCAIKGTNLLTAVLLLGVMYFDYRFKTYLSEMSAIWFQGLRYSLLLALTRRMQRAPGNAPLQHLLVWAKRFQVPFTLPIALWVIGGGLFVLGAVLGLRAKHADDGPLYVIFGGATLAYIGALVNDLRVAVTLLRRFDAQPVA